MSTLSQWPFTIFRMAHLFLFESARWHSVSDIVHVVQEIIETVFLQFFFNHEVKQNVFLFHFIVCFKCTTSGQKTYNVVIVWDCIPLGFNSTAIEISSKNMYISSLVAILFIPLGPHSDQHLITNKSAGKKTTTPIMEFFSCDSGVFLSRDHQSALRLSHCFRCAADVTFTTELTVPPSSLVGTAPKWSHIAKISSTFVLLRVLQGHLGPGGFPAGLRAQAAIGWVLARPQRQHGPGAQLTTGRQEGTARGWIASVANRPAFTALRDERSVFPVQVLSHSQVAQQHRSKPLLCHAEEGTPRWTEPQMIRELLQRPDLIFPKTFDVFGHSFCDLHPN